MERYGMPNAAAVKAVGSAEEFLRLFKLHALTPVFASHAILSVNDLLLLTPAAVEAMGASVSAGQRARLLRALNTLQEAHAAGPSVAQSMIAEAAAAPAERRQPNSTSSLYIESTIANPDIVQVCFCVSLLVHDLVVQAENGRAMQNEQSDAASTFALIRPRHIFFPGKRSRQEFESGEREQPQPEQREVPSEEDIRFAIQEIHKLTKFTPGCLVVAMIYLERLRRSVGAELLASTWQLLLLTSVLVAQKMWEDRQHPRVDFTRLEPSLTPQHLNMIEREFLRLLDYHFTVSAAVYTEWYFKLCELCERNEVRMRPLNQAEASRLEIRTHLAYTQLKQNANSLSGPLEVGPGSSSGRGRVILG